MHTTLVIGAGLILLALTLFIGRKTGASRPELAAGFVVLWLLLSVINGAVGLAAGQPLATELVIGSLVFGVPLVALALYMRA